jgi:predicted nucleotidyltransferase
VGETEVALSPPVKERAMRYYVEKAMETTTLVSQAPGKLIPPETVNGVVQTIALRFDPCRIVLFGSYVDGTATPDSDLGLLVIMETGLPPHKRATPLRLAFDPAPCAMDILVYTPDEVKRWNLRRTIF